MAKASTENTKKSASTKTASKASKAAAPKVAATEASSSKKKKSTIHPNYRIITVEQTNGEKFQTRSTYSNSDTLKLEIDTTTHPAWTKEANYINTKASEVSKFNAKFGGLKLMSDKKA
jgi:large subunit ribosomal protein L31